MPVRPEIKVLTNSSVDVLNAIRNSASVDYRNYVPIATPDAESIKKIGAIIMDYPNLQNEFVSALINRIGRVMITSKMYSNPWSRFKRGFLEFGETIEEIFVELAQPFQFDPAVAETEIFKRVKPDYRSAFHVMNYQKFYKVTISEQQLREAFLTWGGVNDLITRTIEALYTSANYDEFLTMKYLLAYHILNGGFYPISIPAVTAVNMKSIASAMKSISNQLEFMNTDYNRAKVHQHTDKREQYLISNASFDAIMDVEVLASAFNMNKAEFLGNRVLIDGFGKLDLTRLDELFKDDPNYVHFTDEQIATLNAVPAVLIDRDFFMIFDNLNEFRQQENGQGLYWQYWYHQWKTFSVSPFSNAIIFATGTPAVSGITVSPSSATVVVGDSIQLSALANTAYFAPASVTWSSSDDGVTVTAGGLVTVGKGASTGDVTITATSTYDDEVYGTATITVSKSGLVTGVTVSPSTKTLAAGGTQQMTATVATTKDWVNKDVTWSSNNETDVTVSATGLVTVTVGATATHTATITATSKFDTSQTGTATITVGS